MLCKYGKRKLQLADNQLTAILLCCLLKETGLHQSTVIWKGRIGLGEPMVWPDMN